MTNGSLGYDCEKLVDLPLNSYDFDRKKTLRQ